MTWGEVEWDVAEVVETLGPEDIDPECPNCCENDMPCLQEHQRSPRYDEDARCPVHGIVLLVEEQMQCPHCRAEENDGWIEHEHDRENPQGDCQNCYPDIDLSDDD